MTTVYVDNVIGQYDGGEAYDGLAAAVGGGHGPYKRIASACNHTNVHQVWIKANSGYTFSADDQGASPVTAYSPIGLPMLTVSGYATTPGDGGIVDIYTGDIPEDTNPYQVGTGALPERTACVFVIPEATLAMSRWMNLRITDLVGSRVRHGWLNSTGAYNGAYGFVFENCHVVNLCWGFGQVGGSHGGGGNPILHLGLRRCSATNCRLGVSQGDPIALGQLIVEDSLFDGCGNDIDPPGGEGFYGCSIGALGGFTRITGNLIINNLGRGIFLDYCTQAIIRRNTFYNGYNGVYQWNAGGTGGWTAHSISENIFHTLTKAVMTSAGILDWSSTSPRPLTDNVFWNNGTNVEDGQWTPAANYLIDPDLDVDGGIGLDAAARRKGIVHPGWPDKTRPAGADDSLDTIEYTWPAEAEVQEGVDYGPTGTEYTGSLVIPAPAPTPRPGEGTDDYLLEDMQNECLEHGELTVYYPRSGAPREIYGIIDRRAGLKDQPGGAKTQTPGALIVYPNDSICGIDSAEIDLGGDEIGYAMRRGDSRVRRTIRAFHDHDGHYTEVELS